MEQNCQFLLSDKHDTERFGAALARSIDERAIVALLGQLGAGKTTLVKALAAALGVEEVVSSPTFTMLNEYHSGRLSLYHMDLYRLSEESVPAPLDLMLAELEEFIDSDMVLVVEWAELFPALEAEAGSELCEVGSENGRSYMAQLDHLVIELQYGKSEDGDEKDFRIALVTANGPESRHLLLGLRTAMQVGSIQRGPHS